MITWGHNCQQGAHMHWQGPKCAGTVPSPQYFHFNHWTEAYSADHNWWSTLVGQEFVKATHQIKSAIFHSQQVSEESSNGRLITPRPPGYIEVWRERQVNVWHQTNDAKQSTSQQDCHVQQLHDRWNTVRKLTKFCHVKRLVNGQQWVHVIVDKYVVTC